MDQREQFAELMTRPDVEEAKKRYDRMQAEIRAELTERLDLPKWSDNPATGGGRTCGDFQDIHPFDTATFSRPIWSTQGPLSAEQWSQATEILRRIGGEYGFTKVDLQSRSSETSTYDLSDGKGAGLHFMVNPQNRVVLQVDAGCHLKPESKKRGRPINEEEKETYRSRVHATPSTPTT